MSAEANHVAAPTGPPVLAARYVERVLAGRRRGESSIITSIDLGRSEADVGVTAAGGCLPNGVCLSWGEMERIAATGGDKVGERCFAVWGDDEVEEIRRFSESTNRHYSLLATAGAPTMLISGIQMHRTTGIDPLADTRRKVRSIAPLRGSVLDTATGLGYTAIEAAKTAAQVVTIELDPAALEVARLNPWSRALFTDPRISQRIGDSFDQIQTFGDGSFSRIIHDPPVFGLAGHLYSGAFYEQLCRVLKEDGRVFHYVGNPESPSGSRVTRGVVRRLRAAGFARVVAQPSAFGVVAYK